MPAHDQRGQVEVLSRADLRNCRRWSCALASERKDLRYFDIVEDTLENNFSVPLFRDHWL